MDPAASTERAAPKVTDLVAAFTGNWSSWSRCRSRTSTRFLELRFEHLRSEIGWTWLARETWGSGANVEAKLLLLTHAFEHAGLRRVEFKTDARDKRSRGALETLGAKFEGILRKHMVVRAGSPGTRPTTR
jgi:RimJ/RimL family protein N-acetyltransferase